MGSAGTVVSAGGSAWPKTGSISLPIGADLTANFNLNVPRLKRNASADPLLVDWSACVFALQEDFGIRHHCNQTYDIDGRTALDGERSAVVHGQTVELICAFGPRGIRRNYYVA